VAEKDTAVRLTALGRVRVVNGNVVVQCLSRQRAFINVSNSSSSMHAHTHTHTHTLTHSHTHTHTHTTHTWCSSMQQAQARRVAVARSGEVYPLFELASAAFAAHTMHTASPANCDRSEKKQ
jgi:ABC-type Zn2+ transport system substrate-binding protein/surface adhesin